MAQLSRRSSEILLAACIVARATSYIFSKMLLETMGKFTLLGVRSATAFVLLTLISLPKLRKITRTEAACGFLMGVAFFTVLSFETAALQHTTSVAVSFEENTSVTFVPLMLIPLERKLPDRRTALRVLTALTGVVLLSFKPEGFMFNIGDIYGMMSAVSYAGAIILISKLADKGDSYLMGVVQIGTMAVLALTASVFMENFSLPQGSMQWGYLLYLAVVCSGFGFTLQPFAQKGTTTERAGMLCALNPVTAAVLGMLVLGETLTFKGIIGVILIVVSIVL